MQWQLLHSKYGGQFDNDLGWYFGHQKSPPRLTGLENPPVHRQDTHDWVSSLAPALFSNQKLNKTQTQDANT